ncbi:MAG: hypothetical protein AAFR61_06065 [Bacteroidota bacterium]
MADHQDVQAVLFDKIKELLPPHTSIVDEVADILSISTDGVYRRLRSETPLRLDETNLLCQHFRISMDEILHETNSQSLVFQPSGMRESNLDFETYLQELLHTFGGLLKMNVKESLFSAKDIPVFHLYQYPELVLFKMFFWRSTIFGDPDLAGQRFSLEIENEKQERCISLCRQIAEKYSLIPTTEIWNEETSFSFLKQIGYYYDSGLFAQKSDAIKLIEKVEELFGHLKLEAELGYKFLSGHQPQNRVENFKLYYNDLILIDNVISVETEQFTRTFLIYNSIEYLSTTNPDFARRVRDWLENIMRKSDLISTYSERMRNKFFLKIQDKVDDLKASL